MSIWMAFAMNWSCLDAQMSMLATTVKKRQTMLETVFILSLGTTVMASVNQTLI